MLQAASPWAKLHLYRRWRMLERKRSAIAQKTFSDSYNCCGPPPLSATWPDASMLEVWEHSHSSTPLCDEPGHVEMDIRRAPTPPPFQFSSSSLSAALSGPDRQKNLENDCRSPCPPLDRCDINRCCSPEVELPEIEPSPPPELEPEPVTATFTLLSQSTICCDCSLLYSDPVQPIRSPLVQVEESETAADHESSAESNAPPSTSVPQPSGSSGRSTRRSRCTINPKLSSVLTVGSEQASSPRRYHRKLILFRSEILLAYVCGHEDCWPMTAQQGSIRFATSKKLWDHSKNVHQESMGGSRPFRCGLDGCGKGWKVRCTTFIRILFN
jgi:hypothetical protein